ncbi:hypothetical protein LB505_010846 [Fusarium chuoi]|nr:hypothetical protein LB505_010846 [Fusarium chuoi]
MGNPSLNTSSADCVFADDKSYCMAAYKFVPTYTSVSSDLGPETTKTTATTTANGISTPTPTQTGMVANCNKFHLIKTTTTCQGIADYNEISLLDFYKWNPKVNSDCSNLVLGAYACAGVINTTLQPSTTHTTTTTDNGISTPKPTQSGMVSNCNKFHIIKSTTTCQGIVDYNKITMANLLKWNVGINSQCSNLILGSSVCVGIIGGSVTHSTTTSSTTAGGITTPTPIQSGMTTGCTKFHPVKSTTTCQGILDYNKITLAQFYKWNPAVKSDCSNLWPETYACVAGP